MLRDVYLGEMMIAISRLLSMLLVLGACQTQPHASMHTASTAEMAQAASFALIAEDPNYPPDELAEAVRRRVDAGGFDRVTIEVQNGRLRVGTSASVEAFDRLINLLMTPGALSFHVVDVEANVSDYQPNQERGRRIALADDSQGGKLRVIHVDPIIAGSDIANAVPAFDNQNRPHVSFQLRGAGAQRFARATTTMVGKPFAIVLDGCIISAPTVNSPLTSGSGQITGRFTPEEAEQLAAALRAGPLPKLELVERNAAAD